MTKKFGCFIYLIFVFISFLSCSKDSLVNNDNVFRYNEHSNISSLDPAFASTLRNIWPVNQLFNGLVQLDDSLNIKPDLSESWEISKDGMTYLFKIKKNTSFHKSIVFGKDSIRNVNAFDFEYSFNRLKDPKLASPGAWVLNNVENFKASNDSVFSIKLKSPFAAFLGILSMKYCSVVPKEAVDYYKSKFGKNPIGTGPFKFKKWEENIKLVLRKNNLYFEKDSKGIRLPYLEAISITFLPDKKSEFMEFAQNKIDFINSIDSSFKDQLLNVNGDLKEEYLKSINLLTGPYLNTEYIGFFLGKKKSILQSKKLRLAINYGFDRKKMMKYLRNNIGYPANNGFIPLGLQKKRTKGFEYDLKKALQLIKEYKDENGNQSIEIVLSSDANYLDIVEYIQRELLKIGINIKINILPPSSLRQAKSNGKLEMFRASWIADYPDAENYLSLFYSKNLTPNGPNYTHFKNNLYDKLFFEGIIEQSKDDREKIYSKLDSLIIEEAPIIPLYYDKIMRFSQKNVVGLETNPINQLNLKRVYKK
ncbi:MAG: ABC transporter substrate-binding protein [Flavobacteriaceae bacterium]|nr:ABC transporter substrate-binding protein [Flavobacteriaceae bacterium]MBT5596534.1 ABC transporter substrate-binding protein [Flavobacteriaceae bacterium]MBT6688408.1 ABC transporter substrate-binding protein [Flavobacteriaceae bacterium]